MQKLRWGILATGFIAGRFAEGVASSHTGELVAVSSRNIASAEGFAKKHGAALAFDDHAALLACPEVDAVYIATPHPFHAELAIAAAKADKHILCEKPIAMNMRDTEAVIAAALEAGVTLLEAYMYRCHPQTAKVADLIRDGVLGEIHLVQAAFGYHAPFDPKSRIFAKELGGGGILDVGGYPVSFACMVADATSVGEEPQVSCFGTLGTIDPRCDTDTVAHTTLKFSNGVAAQVSTSTQLTQQNAASVFGSKGWLEISEPWIVAPNGGEWKITVHLDAQDKPLVISGTEERELYGTEADCLAALVRGEKPNAPCMTISDTRRVNSILESWQQQLRDLD